ncbi:hypothetical protein NKI19_31970 [Mesorhizobium sp. M0751]|uniref:hypothetical protein n=1 Tax=unclassified Mesorhizobium TaxID=325217 RepID=UPI003337105B
MFANIARIHNRINATLFDRQGDYTPRFATQPSGGINPGHVRGVIRRHESQHQKLERLLDINNPNHGLLLPILIYCVDKKGGPSSASLGKGPRPCASSSMRHTKTSLVIPALRELHNELAALDVYS